MPDLDHSAADDDLTDLAISHAMPPYRQTLVEGNDFGPNAMSSSVAVSGSAQQAISSAR
ncbi:hypothetical protein [Streptomyces indicus]|uniref:hypothetical protein n=1 Tax=Streptomyces indicus TaxID=417292 RepID=UPI0015A2A79D|nr:hypothetical protein [Streptomyces indicus]